MERARRVSHKMCTLLPARRLRQVGIRPLKLARPKLRKRDQLKRVLGETLAMGVLELVPELVNVRMVKLRERPDDEIEQGALGGAVGPLHQRGAARLSYRCRLRSCSWIFLVRFVGVIAPYLHYLEMNTTTQLSAALWLEPSAKCGTDTASAPS